MSDFEIESYKTSSDEIAFGYGTPQPFYAPSTVQTYVKYVALGLDAELLVDFQDGKYVLKSLNLYSKNGEISTTDLVSLRIPLVLRKLSSEVIRGARELQRSIEVPAIEKHFHPQFLANIYTLEYATWGKPTDSISFFMGWSRNNTNTHLRNINKNFPLPGRQKPRKG